MTVVAFARTTVPGCSSNPAVGTGPARIRPSWAELGYSWAEAIILSAQQVTLEHIRQPLGFFGSVPSSPVGHRTPSCKASAPQRGLDRTLVAAGC